MTDVSARVQGVQVRPLRGWLATLPAVVAIVAAACGGGAPAPAAGAPPGGAMPPMPVQVVTLAATPIDDVGEFVGTIKSLQSSTVQPQAEGCITAVRVKSGDHVKPGDVLFDIDATSQQAAVASLESTRAARESDVTLAHQQAVRAKTLLDAGAMSQEEYDTAVAAERSANAQLQAVDQQIKQQQNELSYYHVTATTSGIVGDIPVRRGDRVTKTTTLTTLDTNAGLELYVSVPVQQAPRLHLGLPVRILGDTGQTLATEPITFIAPSVDDATQTVLVKAAVAEHGDMFRPDEYVRAGVVWRTTAGVTVPVTAVVRVNGQFFAYVAENGPHGLVARQRQLTLGPVVGNNYVVTNGLAAGDRLIVGGIQKIGDGSPVQALPPSPPGAAPSGGGSGGQ